MIPDRQQMERFVGAAFVEAPPGSFVVMRSFYDDVDGGPPFESKSVRIDGPDSLDHITERAFKMAENAAACPRPIVFCPSLATYTRAGSSKAADLAAGLVLTVESDENPKEAKARLSAVLGVPSLTVASGGTWANPETGEIEDKLHLHWILTEPAIGPEALEKLHKARSLACDLVGADATSKAIVHPLRWPGSLHRKRPDDPRLCRILDETDNRLDLDEALEELSGLEALRDSVEGEERGQRGGKSSPLSGDLLADCAALIPNDDTDWATWNRLGMAYWRASEGSAEGFDAFDAWSQKSGKYDAKTTRSRWQHYATSPPDKIGAGTLVYLARKADPDFMRRRQTEASDDGQPRMVSEDEALAPFYTAIAELNERYFVVDLGGAVTIASFHRDQERGRDRLVLMKRGDFALKYSHRHYLIGWNRQTGKEIWKPLGDAWLENPRRRSFDRVTMSTDPNLPDDVLNLWRGFGCNPRPGGWPTIESHLRTIICKGNERDFKYLEKLFARWVKNPVSCGEVAFVMKGLKGTGKGAVARLMCRIFKHHAMTTAHARDITGNFNSHLMDLCLLFLDEAIWAGDKQAEGTLKALVTEPDQRIEPKGVNVFSVPNRLKIIMATNNDWVVPASQDERRYFVVEVSDAKLGDEDYFKKLFAAIDGAEGEAFLHHLLHLDLSDFNHRAVPHTDALNNQKLISGDHFQKWWTDCLYSRGIVGSEFDSAHWPEEPRLKTAIHNGYVQFCLDHGERYSLSLEQFAKRLYEVSTTKPCRPRANNPNREPMFALPSLEQARVEFLAFMRIDAFDWADDDAEA